jgi:hypothetical protein
MQRDDPDKIGWKGSGDDEAKCACMLTDDDLKVVQACT